MTPSDDGDDPVGPKPGSTAASSDRAKPAAPRRAADKSDKAITAATPKSPAIPKPPPWWKTLRADPPVHIRMALGIGFIAVIFGLWYLVTVGDPVDRIISPVRLPSPGEVFGSMFGGTAPFVDQPLSPFDSFMASLQRVFLGVALATVVGVGLGILAAAQRGVAAALAPMVIFLRSIPMGALVPITLLLFSLGENQKTMFIFLAVVAFVFSDTVKAVASVPERYVETAQTLGASRFQIVRKVLIPLALPDIFTSLRFQLGLALGYIMLAEEINTTLGIGRIIKVAQDKGHSEHIYLVLFLIAVIAFGMDLLLRTIQRGVFPWRRDL